MSIVVPEFPVYLFDVDGTLTDSAADICGAVNAALADVPHPACDESLLRRYIGFHLADLFRDLIPDHTPEQFDEFLSRYRSVYHAREHASTRVFPGVVETLSALPGLKSTATTKMTSTTRGVLERFDLLRYFDHVQGTDGFPAKPEPDVVLKSVEKFGVRPEDCLFIGDAVTDMEAGHRAGVKICAVTYGYGNHQDMARWEPDYWIHDLRQLLPFTSNGESGRLAAGHIR